MVPNLRDSTKVRVFMMATMPSGRSGNCANNAGVSKVACSGAPPATICIDDVALIGKSRPISHLHSVVF